jgi:hypothetical protein
MVNRQLIMNKQEVKFSLKNSFDAQRRMCVITVIEHHREHAFSTII